jgi:hypothetical protein
MKAMQFVALFGLGAIGGLGLACSAPPDPGRGAERTALSRASLESAAAMSSVLPSGDTTELALTDAPVQPASLGGTRSPLYVGNCYYGNIAVLGVPGDQLWLDSGGWCTQGLAFDAAGNLYYAEGFWYMDNYIMKRDLSGHLQLFAAGGLIGGFSASSPESLATDSRGNLYVVGAGANYVVKVDSSGAQSELPTQGLTDARGIAVDLRDNVFISSNGTDEVLKVDPTGTQTVFAQVPAPLALVFDDDGSLFAGTAAGDIFKIDRAGNRTLFSPGAEATIQILPMYMASDGRDLFVSDVLGTNNVIRVDGRGMRSVLPGGASINAPTGLAFCRGAACSVPDLLLESAYEMLIPPLYAWGKDPNNWVFGSILGGDANKGTDLGDQPAINELQEFRTVAPDNSYTNEKWSTNIEGVSRCNLALAAREGGAQAVARRAELRFLRGFYYFELAKVFGPSVPWVDEGGTVECSSTAAPFDIRDKVEADFRFAADHLPAVSESAGRVNSWAAKAFLAKLLLFRQRFQEAKDLFDEIIAEGRTTTGIKYALHRQFERNFDAAYDNGAESVFAQQADLNGGTNNRANPGYTLAFPYGNGWCCGFFQPSQSLVNSFKVDASGRPLFDPDHRSFPFNARDVKSDQGIPSDQPFTPEAEPLDPRLDWTVGRRGIPYLDWGPHPGMAWIRDQSYGGPYSPIKNVFRSADFEAVPPRAGAYNGWANASTTNYNFIRFADVLLMAAECEVEVGSLDRARHYVNQVRRRADHSRVKAADGTDAANYRIRTYPSFPSRKFAREAVRFERKLELAMEGHRFFDLIRWGGKYASKELNDGYLGHEGQHRWQFADAYFDPQLNSYAPFPQASPTGGNGRTCANGQ